MGWVVTKIIRLYQILLSPDHSWRRHFYVYGFCRYYPSCSQYAIEAIERKGLVKGLFRAGLRILRCRPGKSGGIDKIQ